MIVCLEKLMLDFCDVKAEDWALKELTHIPTFVSGPLGMSHSMEKTRIRESLSVRI